MGELLVSFILLEKRDPNHNIPPPRKIEPATRKAFLDIHAIGLRGLVKKNGFSRSIRSPYLYFDLYSAGYGDSAKTQPSKTPTPTDPNYLDR